MSKQPKYVYEISSEMNERSNGRFKVSVLYPVLYRLEEQGYVKVARTEIVNNRARSYYRITDEGLDYLNKTKAEFCSMVEVVKELLDEDI
ncbi:MAG: PadR family transcriptional regulator [Oscillospiraceae bacterium]